MPSLQKVVANFTGITRNESLHGKEYLVAPAIMIVEGVLNGSNGPLLYPVEELRKSVSLWNSKPAVLYHPEKNGEGISACSPEVLNTRGLGMMMNTKMDGNQLKTEVWLDMKQVEKVDDRVLDAVENNKMLELSTGLLTDNEMTEGEWDGVHYDAIARNYRPDHLAILPDQKGACSIEDGAGFLRLNKAGDALTFLLNDMEDNQKEWIKENKERVLRTVSNLVLNDMSDDDKRNLLYGLLNKGENNEISAWIVDVFSEEGYFVYEKDGTLFKQEFEEKKEVLSLKGIPTTVKKIVTYSPTLNRKGETMPKTKGKKKIVNGLIENKTTQWTEDNREWLMTQEEDILDNMNPIVSEEDAKTLTLAKEVVEKAKEATKNKEKENVPIVNTQPKTMDEYLKGMPPEMRDMVSNGIASHNADKKRLVNVITANDRNIFTDEQLESKSLSELRQLAALATTTDTQRQELATVNYGGQAETVYNEDVEEPLEQPALNFEKSW